MQPTEPTNMFVAQIDNQIVTSNTAFFACKSPIPMGGKMFLLPNSVLRSQNSTPIYCMQEL